jgi:hypothetical protein
MSTGAVSQCNLLPTFNNNNNNNFTVLYAVYSMVNSYSLLIMHRALKFYSMWTVLTLRKNNVSNIVHFTRIEQLVLIYSTKLSSPNLRRYPSICL